MDQEYRLHSMQCPNKECAAIPAHSVHSLPWFVCKTRTAAIKAGDMWVHKLSSNALTDSTHLSSFFISFCFAQPIFTYQVCTSQRTYFRSSALCYPLCNYWPQCEGTVEAAHQLLSQTVLEYERLPPSKQPVFCQLTWLSCSIKVPISWCLSDSKASPSLF